MPASLGLPTRRKTRVWRLFRYCDPHPCDLAWSPQKPRHLSRCPVVGSVQVCRALIRGR